MNLTATCPPITAIPASLVAEVKRLAKCVEPSASFGHVAYRVPTDLGVAKCVTRLDIDVPGGRIRIMPADVSVAAENTAWRERSLLFLADHDGREDSQRRFACNAADVEYLLVRSLQFARTGE